MKCFIKGWWSKPQLYKTKFKKIQQQKQSMRFRCRSMIKQNIYNVIIVYVVILTHPEKKKTKQKCIKQRCLPMTLFITSIGDPEQKSKTTTNLTTPSTVWPKQNQRLQCSFFAFGGLRTRSTLLPPIARPSRSWRLALRNDAARLTSNQQHERTSTIRLSREWVRRKEAIKQPYKKDYEWLKNLRLYYYYYCHQFRPCCILQ